MLLKKTFRFKATDFFLKKRKERRFNNKKKMRIEREKRKKSISLVFIF